MHDKYMSQIYSAPKSGYNASTVKVWISVCWVMDVSLKFADTNCLYD